MYVSEFVSNTFVFLHNLSPFLGPAYQCIQFWASAAHVSGSLWLQVAGGSHGMAAPDVLFCRPGLHDSACPDVCCPAEATAGGIHMGALHSTVSTLQA